MSLKKLRNSILSIGLMAVMLMAVAVMIRADGSTERGPEKKGEPCYDYDRNEDDETSEKPRGDDCPGNVPTPEPVSILLFSAGLAGVGFVARRRLRRTE